MSRAPLACNFGSVLGVFKDDSLTLVGRVDEESDVVHDFYIIGPFTSVRDGL